MSTATVSSRDIRRLPGGFGLVYVGRFISNVSFRLVYPFLPQVARGLGTSLDSVGQALALRDLAGLATPAVGRAVDRMTHRKAMAAGLVLASLMAMLAASANGLLWLTVSLAVLNLGKNLFDIGSASWLAHHVPFRNRGHAVGILETSWAAAFFLFMPVAALLIRVGTWRTPFVVVSVLCLCMAVLLYLSVDDDDRLQTGTLAATLQWSRRLVITLVGIVFVGAAHQIMLVTFASWLEDEHGLSIEGLGATALVLGLAELGGSTATALTSDRVGTRLASLGALALVVPVSLLLPLGGRSVGMALVLLSLWFLLMESGWVTFLALASELDPEARGRVISFVFASFTMGHAAGAVIGTSTYDSSGIGSTSVVTAVTMAVGVAILWAVVHDPGRTPRRGEVT